MVITVQDYKEIRQRFLAGESQRHIAKTLGISRNTVAKYCDGSALPDDPGQGLGYRGLLGNDKFHFVRPPSSENGQRNSASGVISECAM